MRKIAVITFAYSVVALITCLVISFLTKDVPILLPGEEFNYIIFRGLLYFFYFFPALCGSSFLIGCAILFGKDSHKAKIKFSPFIIEIFKKTMIASIVLVFLISIITEVAVPLCEQRQARAKFKPVIFKEYMTLAKQYYEKKEMSLAFEYAYNALLINPKDKEAQDIKERAEANPNSQSAYRKFDEVAVPKITYVPKIETEGETVTSLIKKAKAAMENEKWFDAHYYAYLAFETGTSKDINIDEAKRISSEAWNHLFEIKIFSDTDDQKLFRQKREAYMHFIDGDNIGAYYSFLAISKSSQKASTDHDVIKFMGIAEERIREQYFFIDEVENLRKFEAYRDVYFTISHSDGTKDVVYIRGITPVKNSGRMIQYLRNFNILKFSPDGTFMKSLSVPYAKMYSEPVESFNEEGKEKFDIKDSYKRVPYIMLNSISRSEKDRTITPVYEYNVDFDDEEENPVENAIVLSISSTEFNLICDTVIGEKRMNFVSPIKLLPKVRDFGYSLEVFSSDFLYRITYPFVMLIFMIFIADIAWNYRLMEDQMFKFKWVFMMPFLTLIFYYLLECVIYVIKFLNYVLISVSSYMSIFILIGMLIIVLIAVSYIFLSRTSE